EVRFWIRNPARMAGQDLERMFRKFERLGDNKHAEGWGLGLYIARSLVALLRGKIEATADQGMLTVAIELPATWVDP
ncbi:MAG: hypothetical protein KGR26_07190, partial [Cyanobacteria bacterium REEB65]|nr:hypothetical protein [Cyanobacteria bacterium REEB65]